MKALIYFPLLFLFFNSCVYTKDKLIIKNESLNDIWIVTQTQNKVGKDFYEISGGCEIKCNETNSPIIRSEIANELKSDVSNGNLNVVFCHLKDIEYVNNNLNTIVNSKKFKVNKYTVKQLDSLKWIIKY